MYLKSIEVHGFKAFANKIRFEFDGGITGIVGPNGSGKSNVADAVRWVLGEQSAKQLRGSSMQDVIFAGTEARKPMGFAYVALTLDNSDHKLPISYEEVTVARRVYRSGESEYLINGAECRLRDVQELFFDTGIGKEGYSLIGQGQIDKILSGKPEERREIFDEAAGITKVKKRKIQTEKNLAEERANLARVNDIIAEIEGRIEPLERQSEKARKYLDLREELKTREVNQFLTEYEKSENSRKELDDKLEIVTADLNRATQNYEEAREEYDRLLNMLENHREELSRAKETCATKRVEAERGSGDRNVLVEQIASLTQMAQQFTDRGDRLRSQMAEREEELSHYEETLANLCDELEALEEAKDAAEGKLAGMKTQLTEMLSEEQTLREEQIAALQEGANRKAEMERNNARLEQYGITRAEIAGKLLKFRADADEANRQTEEATEALREAVNKVADATEEQSKRETRVKELTSLIAEASEQWDLTKKKAIEAASRFETMHNLVERYDGYAGTVRRVMEKKTDIPGIHGVVADIIQTEGKYETAVETALGGNIQNVVVDSAETAKRLIDYLKSNRLGRATFLPLKEIRAKKEEFDKAVFKKPGVIGVASGLVNADEMYREAVEYLLGRFLVVDTVDHAIALSREYKQKLRLVTLEGELFAPGGAISGGSFKNNSNLLGRRREAEELEAEAASRKAEAEACEKTVGKYRREREVLRNDIEISRKKLQELMLAQNTAKMNLDHVKEQNGGLLSMREALTKEASEAEAACERIKDSNRVLAEEFAEYEETGKAKLARAEELRREIDALRGQEDEASAEAVRTLTEYNALKQSVSYRRDSGDRMNRELEALQDELKSVDEGYAAASEQIHRKEARVRELEEEQCELQKEIQDTEAQIVELSALAEEITKQNRDFFEKRENLSKEMTSLDKEQFRLQNQREKMEEQLDSQTHYMWEEYQLTYTQACELRNPEYTNSAQNRKAVYELKNRIRELGNVNVNAIEEYRETKERYEFLSGQRADITAAEQTLVGIIEALDTEMRKQFEETFAELKVRFDRIFRELFGGGKTSLSLMEDEDVLEAGILVNAQPPGKKLQNMLQLSGGEKALTAIALLFAILDLKPSPFCLLDEIEAALDDSNVSRFAQYLRKLSHETQFIVITHRRGTMAAADALYGITMQEKGVSTLVSVNLIENELDK